MKFIVSEMRFAAIVSSHGWNSGGSFLSRTTFQDPHNTTSSIKKLVSFAISCFYGFSFALRFPMCAVRSPHNYLQFE